MQQDEPEQQQQQPETSTSSKQDDQEIVIQDDGGDAKETAKETTEETKETTETMEAKSPEKETDATFETLDEYKHVDDDDVILIEDGHPVGSKKSKTEIVKEAEAKLKEEKEKEEKRKEVEAKKAARQEYFQRLNEKRDGDLKDLPPRDVESFQCEWVVMDRALELCPQFKKVHETTIFQEHLSKFLQQIADKKWGHNR